jgi:hypothetical protein
MALTDLQMRIMQRLAANRSETSYLAGGVILNLNWPRRSDDIDIFHDTDEEVARAALKDIADLESGGFRVSVDVKTYGLFEATVSDDLSSTTIQWMSETRRRTTLRAPPPARSAFGARRPRRRDRAGSWSDDGDAQYGGLCVRGRCIAQSLGSIGALGRGGLAVIASEAKHSSPWKAEAGLLRRKCSSQ